jgi:hypothetical protein
VPAARVGLPPSEDRPMTDGSKGFENIAVIPRPRIVA